MNVERKIVQYKEAIDGFLHKFISEYAGIPAELRKGMLYAVFPGGKRFRPVLFLAAVDALGSNPYDYLPFASAIELIHSFSLVHDDLPPMDNDLFRRKKPTLHRYIGEAKALLVGDALAIMAFELASLIEMYGRQISERNILKAIRELAKASGAYGMTGGQFLDIDVARYGTENRNLLIWIHEHKTGALIRVSVSSAAILTGSSEAFSPLSDYGSAVGRMFQLIDDILDAEEDDKVNYAKSVGVQSALKEARELYDRAIEKIAFLGYKGGVLSFLAHYVLRRGEEFVNFR